MKLSPDFFEDLAVKLLVSMGCGDGEVTQRTHDGGIDGIIREDKLGFGKIFIQAIWYKFFVDNLKMLCYKNNEGALFVWRRS